MSNARKEVLDGLYTCGAGQIRNPRSRRCVRADGRLGRALHAAAQALRTNGAAKPCPKGVYDAATGKCTRDKARAAALRDLQARYRLASGYNGESAATAKLVAGQAFGKAVAADAVATLQAQLARARAEIDDLRNRLALCQSAPANVAAVFDRPPPQGPPRRKPRYPAIRDLGY